ncbi:sulfatase [candidate division KSB1 bacterium]|nr:sulfatase [candidate division KSB1 bacterium]
MNVNQTNRREFMKTVGMGAAALAVSKGFLSCGGKGRAPNIVFIMTDDHAAHALSCYGSRINRTPNLDRIADEGMRFDNCFCTNAICAPSRAVILTGKYSHLNGVIDNRKRFDSSQQAFPKLLQSAGYQTAMIGKWHLKTDPTGFDYWNILPGQGQYYNPDLIEMGERKRHTGYVTDIITDIALDWLKQRNTAKPFCLMYQHKAPHRNWMPGPEHLTLYDDVDIPEPDNLFDDYATRSRAAFEQEMTIDRHLYPVWDLKLAGVAEDEPNLMKAWQAAFDRMTDEQKKAWNAAYDPKNKKFRDAKLEGKDLVRWKYQRYIKDYLRCVASVDDNVGRLLDYLDVAGLAENTIVVYTSDQGFFLGDHGWFDKRFMYEESLRMPLLLRYPARIKPASANDALISNIDFAPTFLSLCGQQIPADMQGESLQPLLAGNIPGDWRDSIYFHYYEYPAWHMVKKHYGIRTKRYKLMHFYDDIDAWELYDLKTDPGEMKNVYADPEYADIVQMLMTDLKQLQQKYGDTEAMQSMP